MADTPEDVAAAFLNKLVKLCREHDAVLFARRSFERPYVSLRVGALWLDFERIDGEKARQWE